MHRTNLIDDQRARKDSDLRIILGSRIRTRYSRPSMTRCQKHIRRRYYSKFLGNGVRSISFRAKKRKIHEIVTRKDKLMDCCCSSTTNENGLKTDKITGLAAQGWEALMSRPYLRSFKSTRAFLSRKIVLSTGR